MLYTICVIRICLLTSTRTGTMPFTELQIVTGSFEINTTLTEAQALTQQLSTAVRLHTRIDTRTKVCDKQNSRHLVQ